MSYAFLDRAAKLEPKSFIAGDRPGKTYGVGRHVVTVYDDGEVTSHQPKDYYSNRSSTLPSLEVVDGQIKIAMEDLIDEILARIEPEELAVSLWANDEVKERFMEALCDRYSYANVGDDDRRKFIEKVKEQIHSKQLDELHSAIAKLEYGISTAWSCWDEIRRANKLLLAYDAKDHNGEPLLLKDASAYGQFSIGGGAWNEAREHWRQELRDLFGLKGGAA